MNRLNIMVGSERGPHHEEPFVDHNENVDAWTVVLKCSRGVI